MTASAAAATIAGVFKFFGVFSMPPRSFLQSVISR
jgi:hypothetical protein